MKYFAKTISLSVSLILMIFLTSMTSAEYQNNDKKAHIEFKDVTHDYGVIKQGDDGSCEFKFTNTGDAPLIINSVKASCGCTVPQKPNKPIMPGATDVIKVKYDTRRLGLINKTITVSSNADNASVVLRIKGEIKPKPKEDLPEKPVNPGFTPVAN